MYSTVPNRMESPEVARFAIVKQSWKGAYARILVLNQHTFSTLDPKDHRVTNEWSYRRVQQLDIAQWNDVEVTIQIQPKKGSLRLMKFQTLDRARLVTQFVELQAACAFALGIPSNQLLPSGQLRRLASVHLSFELLSHACEGIREER